ncbi:MAG TPA: hypothetical protein VL461_00010 [Dictyobacter sp.]|nr:hypothetical protein [Dictyobacter sp.]
MNGKRDIGSILRKPSSVVAIVSAILCILLAVLSYRLVLGSPGHTLPDPPQSASVSPTQKATPTIAVSPTVAPIVLPVQDPSKVLGIAGDVNTNYAGIPWVRIGYPTCGWGNLKGQVLQQTIQKYHKQGIRVLLTVCQPDPKNLFNASLMQDAARGNADAVQCGNEEMKQDASVSFLYVSPNNFARFYDMCASAVHQVRAATPVLLGSLDPHVVGPDYQLLMNQVNYLDQMQNAMNTSVHPGGDWDWHTQTLGLIDSWHNGYAGSNNLRDLFSFWAQQLHINLNSGQLGKHLWVVEGTGCFKGCGIPDDAYDQAVAHILTLTTDITTTMQYHVPFFYFSGRDFYDQGIYWPIGVLDDNGHAKPLREDLKMGARTLTLSCPGGKRTTVQEQEQLLAQLYSGCTLPSNYAGILTS